MAGIGFRRVHHRGRVEVAEVMLQKCGYGTCDDRFGQVHLASSLQFENENTRRLLSGCKGVSVRNSWRYNSGAGKTREWKRGIEMNADEIPGAQEMDNINSTDSPSNSARRAKEFAWRCDSKSHFSQATSIGQPRSDNLDLDAGRRLKVECGS
jgi:hypothetical protein